MGGTARRLAILAARAVRLDQRGERNVGDRVAVVREEDVVVDPVADGEEPLADARIDRGVHEVDPPALRSEGPAPEVAPDHFRLVADAEHEVAMPEVGVVLHDVPEERPAADRDHRLRHDARDAAQPQPEPTAEEDDLHRRLSLIRAQGSLYPRKG